MKRETLMSQVMIEHCKKNAHNMPVINELMQTWTNPQSMKWVAQLADFRISCYKNEFHLFRFEPYIDEDGEEDALHIEHNFYF